MKPPGKPPTVAQSAGPAVVTAPPAQVDSLKTVGLVAPKAGIVAIPDSLVAAWDTQRIDSNAFRETLLQDVHLDLEAVGGSWTAFPDFLKRLKGLQNADPDHRHVTLVLNVHGNNGTGLKVVSYRQADKVGINDAASATDAAGKPTHVDVSIASAAQINEWLKEAGFDPDDVTIVSELCNGGKAYLVSVDGFNTPEKTAAITQAKKLATKEHVALGSVVFHDPAQPKADLTYHWIGRKSGGNTAGSVFLQVATGMGTGVTGKVSAAPLVDLNRLGQPGKVTIAVTGERNPWPDAHFNAMIADLRAKSPRFFPAPGPKAADNQ
ncbi:MAG: hypothetical protein H7338_23125 [Candidatus Sericytochromatia bacterium]|nr:hypothetical protein [Candidatus Sericytochromatia bacterium]